jgi:hypothetical protein
LTVVVFKSGKEQGKVFFDSDLNVVRNVFMFLVSLKTNCVCLIFDSSVLAFEVRGVLMPLVLLRRNEITRYSREAWVGSGGAAVVQVD